MDDHRGTGHGRQSDDSDQGNKAGHMAGDTGTGSEQDDDSAWNP